MDAFAGLAPIHEGYAHLPVADAFEWGDAATALPQGHEWYMVAFRSVRRADADEARLCEFDERAHLEAASVPGFVHYFRGPTAADRSCVSFCLWLSRADARVASGLPGHREAVSLIQEMYDRYTLEFLRVRRGDGARELIFEPYEAVPLPIAS